MIGTVRTSVGTDITRRMTAVLASMTGFARAEGSAAGLAWAWELRSVNGRGLDLRFRLPPGWDALEPALREAAGKALKRGNVTANLSVKRESEPRLVADPAALEQVLALAMDLHRRIPGSPVPRAEALLGLPGVLRPAQAEEDGCPIRPRRRRASRARWRHWWRRARPRARGWPRRSPACWTRSPRCTARPRPRRPISPRRSARG